MKMEMGDVLVSVEEKEENRSREIFRTPFSFSFLLIFIPSSSFSFLSFFFLLGLPPFTFLACGKGPFIDLWTASDENGLGSGEMKLLHR